MVLHQWQLNKKNFTLVDDLKAKKFALRYIQEGDNILDIGCGDCKFFDIASKFKPNSKFYGFDIIPQALEICKKKGYNPVSSLTNLKLKFGVITMFECFEHLDYKERFNQVKIINNLLKSNGYVVLSFPHVSSFLSILHYGDNPEHQEPYPSSRNITKFFSNYEIVEITYFNPWLNPFKILHCIITGLSFNAIYNNVCYVLKKKN